MIINIVNFFLNLIAIYFIFIMSNTICHNDDDKSFPKRHGIVSFLRNI